MATAVHEPVLWGDLELAAAAAEDTVPEPLSWAARAFAAGLFLVQLAWLGALYALLQLLL